MKTFNHNLRLAGCIAATTVATTVGGMLGAGTATAIETSNQTQLSVSGSSMLSSAIPGSSELSGRTPAGSAIPNDLRGFYASIPLDVQGAPGDLLKSQRGVTALGLPYVDLSAGNTTNIAFVSRNSRGELIPVTGSVIRSVMPWNGGGERPTLLLAPGTMGSADQCSASRLGEVGLNYEIAPATAALLRGWNVVITDHPGLGVPGLQHTYMNRVDQGRALLDAGRASIRGGFTSPDAPVVTWGYSQGGGTSAAALELAPEYAPELNLKGGYAGGTPASLEATATAIDSGALAGVMGYTLNGMLQSNPEIRPALEEVFNERGWEFVQASANECVWDSLAFHGFKNSAELTKDGRSILELLKEEPFSSLVKAQEVGNRVPAVPVFVGHGAHDDSIPVAQARELVNKWCAAGARVHYHEVPAPPIAPLVDHGVPMFALMSPAFQWLDQVVAGRPVPTNACG